MAAERSLLFGAGTFGGGVSMVVRLTGVERPEARGTIPFWEGSFGVADVRFPFSADSCNDAEEEEDDAAGGVGERELARLGTFLT